MPWLMSDGGQLLALSQLLLERSYLRLIVRLISSLQSRQA